MTHTELALTFHCGSDLLVGVIARPAVRASSVGVLIVTGGPQYRVGSHRQFVLLSRELADAGIPSMRFDYRGMGDATGDVRHFEEVSDDIRAAIDTFAGHEQGLDGIVLLGLCDGASASCLYAARDRRVRGVALLNPWVRTEAGEAKTYLKHYYLRRLRDPDFWRKLRRGAVSIAHSWSSLRQALTRAARGNPQTAQGDLPSRMAAGLATAGAPLLLILSGQDYVAREFDLVAQSHPVWSRLLTAARVERLEDADHTFSRSEWRSAVAVRVIIWIEQLFSARPRRVVWDESHDQEQATP